MKLVQSSLLALVVLALSVRAESEAEMRAKAPARYTKFCAEYKTACMAVATEDTAKGNTAEDVKYTCSKTFGKPSTKYRLACSAKGVSYQEAALKRVGLGAASTTTAAASTMTTVTLTTSTSTSVETSTIYDLPPPRRRDVADEGATDYIVGRSEGAERRDFKTFCAAYVASCKKACHAAGSKSSVRTCEARNELKGQYSLNCRCANKNIRTQTALISMAKEMNLVEVPGPTATVTSTSVVAEVTATTTIVHEQIKPIQNTDYCPDGQCTCTQDANSIACQWQLKGNGVGGMASSYKAPCVGQMQVDMIGGAAGSTSYQGYFAAGSVITRTFANVEKDSVYQVQIGGTGESYYISGKSSGGWPNGGAGATGGSGADLDTAGGGGSTELQQLDSTNTVQRIMVAGGGGGNAGKQVGTDKSSWYGKEQDGAHTTETSTGGQGINGGGGGGGGVLGGDGGDGLGGFAGSSTDTPSSTRPGFTLGQMKITYTCAA